MSLLKDWYARFEIYRYVDDERARLSFELSAYFYNIQPLVYFASLVTNRWRMLTISFRVGRRAILLGIPVSRLPDYVPDERRIAIRSGNRYRPPTKVPHDN